MCYMLMFSYIKFDFVYAPKHGGWLSMAEY